MDTLKCQSCGAAVNDGQNFCGECGAQLNTLCPGCNTSNPPHYNFCGNCGRNLTEIGSVVLDRSGLIQDANETALGILLSKSGVAIGKPFSLFVCSEDLATFFSHWNEFIKTGQAQTLEVGINSSSKKVRHVKLALSSNEEQNSKSGHVQMEIDDATTYHHTNQELQEKTHLLDSIETITHTLHYSNGLTNKKIAKSILSKIGAVSDAHYAFMARIGNRHEPIVTDFSWRNSSAVSSGKSENSGIQYDQFEPVMKKMGNGRPLVVSDINALPPLERQIWQIWQHQQTGALMCRLIYHGQSPIALIGVFKHKIGLWNQEATLVLKIAANLLAGVLFKPHREQQSRDKAVKTVSLPELENEKEEVDLVESTEYIDQIAEDLMAADSESTVLQLMQIEPGNDTDSDTSIPVFATDDGVCMVTCTQCKRQEPLSISIFEELGWVLRIVCPCKHTFTINREMRHAYRKAVQFDGLFAKEIDDTNKLAVTKGWSAIEVTNISKRGLNFTTPNARMLNVGELVQVKFNLDNSSKTLIEKSAEIKSIRTNNVGCQFQGSGKQDVSLGFYFI